MRIKEIHFAWDNPLDDLEERFAHYTEKAKHRPKGRYGTVYVLTNYGSTFEQDLYRVECLDALGFDPYVMIYDKPNSSKRHRQFQRWVNNKMIFRSCNFDEYGKKSRAKKFPLQSCRGWYGGGLSGLCESRAMPCKEN